ncbi:putative helicase associated domain (HA2) Add an annotation [Lyophyllum shimeji]|uniref:RNA helicase n=1 Tax=Lyophyllum shimeji TaxID=47721 RepID=A0A9P3PNH4_LYOSH|nr:putative helicase associated domain (HA2) Add an annotation [Lyophyllum shimeji]
MDHAQRVKRARQSASRKKGKLIRARKADAVSEPAQVDPNASILAPKSKEEKDKERREKLRQELAAQSESKWSSKKKKRLEKYIDKKLKKEERVRLFEKLAQTQAEIPSSFELKTSSSLGTGKVSTHKERLERLEDKEVRRALDGRTGKRKRNDHLYAVVHANESYSEEEDEGLVASADEGRKSSVPDEALNAPTQAPAIVQASVTQPVASTSAAVGSALKRNADGTVAAPNLRQRTKGKAAFGSWKNRRVAAQPSAETASDTSFDSSDSAYDSSEDESDRGEIDGAESGSESGSSEDDQDDDEGEEMVKDEAPAPRKSLGFKEWAMKQLSAAKGHDVPTESKDPPADPHLSPPPKKKRKMADPSQPTEMRGPLGSDLELPDTTFAQRLAKQGLTSATLKVKAVTVTRPPDAEEARIMLPIVTEEQPIVEAVLLNPVVIICGETGSGKTTQVPQFLYEAGFGTPGSDNPGIIGITQPRRVAAMSMAARVAHELSLTSSRVSYQIRYDATVSPSTSIKFMTDGVLLRELATDFLLSKYSVIIIDEAHERSINTDILIGVLSRVLKLRETMWKEGKEGAKPLRLIIMSATLRVSDFAENRTLFSSPPPVINVAARQHPVTIHFSRRTASDYVTEAIKKTTKIHTRLPPGGILIFLTGQNEIQGVCRKLEAKFGQKAVEAKRKRRGLAAKSSDTDQENHVAQTGNIVPAQADVEAEDLDLGDDSPRDLAFDVDEGMDDEDPDALDSDGEEGLNEELGLEDDGVDVPMHVVPLYSLLPSERQMRVFEPPPPGSRLVVVSTNVAETSLTIPGIRYVVDCGRAKERRYDVKNGIQAFVVSWISKASAAQRAGRAGRTGPGHCYRLYSSALFEHHFDKFSLPEINRMPIEGVVLQMKSMHIDAVVNFPFPTPPERSALHQAEKVLVHLGALSPARLLTTGADLAGGQITDLGKTMSLFPLSPRFSRMLVNGQQHGCLPYVITIVSALSVGDPFLHDEGLAEGSESGSDAEGELAHLTSAAVKAREARRLRRKAFFESQHTHASLGRSTSDVFKVLSVVGAYEYAGGGHAFCAEHFVRPKAMEEIHKLRAQISNIVQINFPGVDAGFVSNLRPPSALQLKVLRQLLTAAFIDQVAVRKDRIDPSSASAQYSTSKGIPYRALGISEDVFIHPSSVLANTSPPEYVVFNEVIRTSRVWLKGLTVINPAWLSTLGKPSLCTFSKPTKNMAGVMMTIPRFGPERWELPPVKADSLQK